MTILYTCIIFYMILVVLTWFRPLWWATLELTWDGLISVANLGDVSGGSLAVVRLITSFGWPFVMLGSMVGAFRGPGGDDGPGDGGTKS